MAQRPMTVQEKIAAIRAGGPAKPAAESAPPPEVEVEAAAEEPIEAPPAAEAVAPTPAPTAASLGRPLSLKEKLAAARAGGAPPAPAAKAAPPPAAVESAADEAPAEVEAPAATAVPAPAPSLGRTMTLQEKLAAARGKAPGAAPAPAAGAKTAAKATTAAPAVKAASTRALPPLAQASDPRDLAEHLRRAGAEKEKASKAAAAAKAAEEAGATPAAARAVGKAATAKKTESKAIPPRPSRDAVAEPTRRAMLVGVAAGLLTSWVFWGWATFTAASVAFLSACARFMFPNVLAEPPSTIKVGLTSNFELGEVNERWKAEWGFWIVRSAAYDGQDKIYALSTICTHLGCPPNWLAAEAKFKCPCHGSGFYISGVNFEGPAPRPLERYKVLIGDDGQMVVDKSQKYQQELGQWADPDSFIQV